MKEALGQSEKFLDFQEQLSRAARVDRPVLLVGERGTGKELAATRVHFLSRRWQGPLVTLNCAALSPTLIESELFGFERGAFTGAEHRRKGRFEAADGGTLFLDEISSIPLQVQEKILRVVEYGTFERVGSTEGLEVNVRILGATNRDLFAMAKEGLFKEDLLDRLCFDVLFLPPLRERNGDIPLLADHFAARMAMELGWSEIPHFTEDAVRAIEEHSWPGNVRELKNTVERAVYRSDTPIIHSVDFHPWRIFGAEKMSRKDRAAGTDEPLNRRSAFGEGFKEAVESFKIALIAEALKTSRFHQQKAARALGLTYHQFRGLLRKYKKGIEKAVGEDHRNEMK
ncbi:MAG: phage shock protein operon transcriptional activator [Desulfobacteraceae bacterium]|nr:MAG: phage shock protein operon transcriptional activator [Desulfobacteraceae bacterium]